MDSSTGVTGRVVERSVYSSTWVTGRVVEPCVYSSTRVTSMGMDLRVLSVLEYLCVRKVGRALFV